MSDVYLARLKLAGLRRFIAERGIELDPRRYPATWAEARETVEEIDVLLHGADQDLDSLQITLRRRA